MLRTKLRVLAAIGGALGLLALGLFAWLSHSFEPSRDAVASATSPDSRVVATLEEINGGATTSFEYRVFVAPSSRPSETTEVARLYAATRSPSAYGANLRWMTPTVLSVEFMDAAKSELRRPMLNIGGKDIATTLKPGTVDSDAPSGGMLYNLRGPNK